MPELFSPTAIKRISALARLPAHVIGANDWKRHTRVLAKTEVLFSGWGAPVMDEAFLRATPQLKAVFYAADAVRYFTTPSLWQRGVRLSAAHAVNAFPIAEFTLASILVGLKQVLPFARASRASRTFPSLSSPLGSYGARVGLVGYGVIARLLRQRLRDHHVHVSVFEPSLSPAEAAAEEVTLHELPSLFAESDVVSLHATLQPENYALIGAEHFRLMPPHATFINTARGELVREEEMLDVLTERPDIQAMIDVCSPSPPLPSSRLFDLPNVLLTPHLSASLGRDCLRLGDAMVDEFERFTANLPLDWEITPVSSA